MPQGNPRPGELYLHFKQKLYQVITVATHSESGEPLVVYQALYGSFQTYARPLAMFVGLVDEGKYPNVGQKYRSQLVEPERDGAQAEKQPKALEPVRTIEEKMMAFFDARTMQEKYEILLDMREGITDRLINNMAVVLDVVIEEGPLDQRYEELKNCVRTFQRYEVERMPRA